VLLIKNQAGTLSDIGTALSGNMTETAAAVNEITANIQNIKGRVINQSRMEEQGEGSKQVLQSVSGLNELTQQVKSSSEEMLNGSQEVMNESRNLEKMTQKITGGLSL
jgi:methyl-accepting chemotaxis protein